MENPSQEQQISKRIADNVSIKTISSIEEGGFVALTKENLTKLVEAPLLEACEELYDKNIQTIMSSANQKDIEYGGNAYIDIDFDSLSEENKLIATQLGELFEMHGFKPKKCIKLKFPVNENTTVGEIRKIAHEAVSKFKKQEMTWAKRYNLDDLAKIYMVPRETLNPESFPDMYYDAQTGYFYESEEHYRKANNPN